MDGHEWKFKAHRGKQLGVGLIDDYALELVSEYVQGEMKRLWGETALETCKRHLHDSDLQIPVFDRLLPKEIVQEIQTHARAVYKKITEEVAAFVEAVESFKPTCILFSGGGSRAHELRGQVKKVRGVDGYYGLYGLVPYHLQRLILLIIHCSGSDVIVGLHHIHRNPGAVRYTRSLQTIGMKGDPENSNPDTLEGPRSRVVYMLQKDVNIPNYVRGIVWTLEPVDADRKADFDVALVTTTKDLSNHKEMLVNSDGSHKVVSDEDSIELLNQKLEFVFSRSRKEFHVYTWGQPDGDMLALHAIARKDGAECMRLDRLGLWADQGFKFPDFVDGETYIHYVVRVKGQEVEEL